MGRVDDLLVDVELGKSGLLYERLFDLSSALGIPASEFLVVDADYDPEARRSSH